MTRKKKAPGFDTNQQTMFEATTGKKELPSGLENWRTAPWPKTTPECRPREHVYGPDEFICRICKRWNLVRKSMIRDQQRTGSSFTWTKASRGSSDWRG